MAQIGIAPIVLKDCTLKIGADNYETNVSSVEFVPTASSVTWKGLTPTAQFTSVGGATWVANLAYAQDWDTPNSLSQYLYDNEGASIVADFAPRNGGPGFRATLVITPGSIGGAVDTVAVATASLGVQGKPARITAGSGVPTITTANPTNGAIAGGNQVQITGRGFTGATSVKFGTVEATNRVVVNDSLIVAIAPAQAAGSKPVTVTNASGVSVASPYTYA